MEIKSFLSVASKLPPHIAVLMRGPTGIGKSALAKQISIELDLPFIDVRGSTMSEGDVGGYPDIEGMKKNNIMTFCMPSWFIRACKEPCLIMLDELNRSLPGVQQSFFQLVLDRELGNDENGVPYKLHPETRVFAAINHGAEYDVNEMDPALLRRFWVTDLNPSEHDWIDWATKEGLDKVLVDFIRQNPVHLRVDPSAVEPGTVIPTPASWHRIAESLDYMKMNPSDVCGGTTPPGFYFVAFGMVGVEAAQAFNSFVQKYDKQITAEDVLKGKVTAKQIKALQKEASTVNGIIDKVASHCLNNSWTRKDCTNLTEFLNNFSKELLLHSWNVISSSNQTDNVKILHDIIGDEVSEIVRRARKLAKK